MSHIKEYDLRGFKGRAFFTTDIHGNFDLLHEKMTEVRFDTSKDLLFVGGDNVDRGPNSDWVIDYINEPWFISVRGNHEEMFLCAYEAGLTESGYSSRMLKVNGGQWAFEETNRHLLDAIFESFYNLPLAVEIITENKRVGIVHAEVPYGDWKLFKKCEGAELSPNAEAVAQWARTKYDRKNPSVVKNIDEVYVGHTPTDSGEIESLGNVHYCDLGAFFRNKLSFIQII